MSRRGSAILPRAVLPACMSFRPLILLACCVLAAGLRVPQRRPLEAVAGRRAFLATAGSLALAVPPALAEQAAEAAPASPQQPQTYRPPGVTMATATQVAELEKARETTQMPVEQHVE